MMTEQVSENYTYFGEVPLILNVDVTPVHFSARGHARQRCAQLCPVREEEMLQDRAEDSPANRSEAADARHTDSG